MPTINDPHKKIVIHCRFVGKGVCAGVRRIAGHGGESPANQGANLSRGSAKPTEKKGGHVRVRVRRLERTFKYIWAIISTDISGYETKESAVKTYALGQSLCLWTRDILNGGTCELKYRQSGKSSHVELETCCTKMICSWTILGVCARGLSVM